VEPDFTSVFCKKAKSEPETQRELVSQDNNNITVADITQLYVRKEDNPDLRQRAAQLEALPKSWRDYFQQ
jgi:MOSC domain-containing protein YiiM